MNQEIEKYTAKGVAACDYVAFAFQGPNRICVEKWMLDRIYGELCRRAKKPNMKSQGPTAFESRD